MYLFRWKTLTWKWVYGYYVKRDDWRNYIFNEDWFEVLPQSVWQWTGISDKNWNKIFWWDFVKWRCWQILWEVKYGEYTDRAQGKHDKVIHHIWWHISGNDPYLQPALIEEEWYMSESYHPKKWNYLEIIWNTTDTPELSK